MKKYLLATSALVLSAGVAAAEVNVTGDGRMGLTYDESAENEFAFHSRLRARFNFSGTTDNGLTFGGWFRAQTAPDAASGNMGTGGGNVFISGAFGRLTMGDADGAASASVGDLHEVGLTGLGFGNETTYFQNNFNDGLLNTGGTNLLYTYSFGDTTFNASIGQINANGADTNLYGALGAVVPAGDVNSYGLGVRHEMGDFAVGVGYEWGDVDLDLGGGFANYDGTHLVLGVEGNFAGVQARAIVGRAGGDLKDLIEAIGGSKTQYGVSVSAEVMPATTVYAYGRRDFLKTEWLGIGAAYDMGGGAAVVGGVVNSKEVGMSSNTRADFGVRFSF